jgi:DNA repair protein RadC
MTHLTDAEKITELNKLIEFGHRTVEACLERMASIESDASIGRVVRAKFKSGNNILVTTITLNRSEIADQLENDDAQVGNGTVR